MSEQVMWAEFDNGYGISVIEGYGAYGNDDAPYECAVLHHGHICYSTLITNDVIGYCTHDAVCRIAYSIATLPKYLGECDHDHVSIYRY